MNEFSWFVNILFFFTGSGVFPQWRMVNRMGGGSGNGSLAAAHLLILPSGFEIKCPVLDELLFIKLHPFSNFGRLLSKPLVIRHVLVHLPAELFWTRFVGNLF